MMKHFLQQKLSGRNWMNLLEIDLNKLAIPELLILRTAGLDLHKYAELNTAVPRKDFVFSFMGSLTREYVRQVRLVATGEDATQLNNMSRESLVSLYGHFASLTAPTHDERACATRVSDEVTRVTILANKAWLK